jgi:hypothetical protein
MKKLIPLLVLAVFVFLLAGCGPTYYETTRYNGRYYQGNKHYYRGDPYYNSYPRHYYPRHRYYRRRSGVNVQIGIYN